MVTRESAFHGMADQEVNHEMSVHADHSTMVKFDSRSNESYVNIRTYIRRLANDAPAVIKDRFLKCKSFHT